MLFLQTCDDSDPEGLCDLLCLWLLCTWPSRGPFCPLGQRCNALIAANLVMDLLCPRQESRVTSAICDENLKSFRISIPFPLPQLLPHPKQSLSLKTLSVGVPERWQLEKSVHSPTLNPKIVDVLKYALCGCGLGLCFQVFVGLFSQIREYPNYSWKWSRDYCI